LLLGLEAECDEASFSSLEVYALHFLFEETQALDVAKDGYVEDAIEVSGDNVEELVECCEHGEYSVDGGLGAVHLGTRGSGVVN
jgi:hypothetical protein